MTLLPMPSPTTRAGLELDRAAGEVRQALADATTVAEAYALWQSLRTMAALMEDLTNEAGARCDRLSEAKDV